MSFSIQFKNFSRLQNFQSDLVKTVNAVFFETAQGIVLSAERAAKERVRSESRRPRGRTGRYLRSIHSELERNPFQVIGKITSDHPQAAVLEFGSRPHVIKARNKKTLFWPGARFPVKKVNHPGTPAFRVLGGAVEQAAENAPLIFNQAIDRKFK